MLELSFKYKGKTRYLYDASLKTISNEARKLFKNDEHSYEYDHDDEGFIKEFLKEDFAITVQNMNISKIFQKFGI